MRVYDYCCTECGTVDEHFVSSSEVRTVSCRQCGGEAKRQVCTPTFKLPGNDPSGFPTAYQKWGDDHERRAKEAAKKNADNDN